MGLWDVDIGKERFVGVLQDEAGFSDVEIVARVAGGFETHAPSAMQNLLAGHSVDVVVVAFDVDDMSTLLLAGYEWVPGIAAALLASSNTTSIPCPVLLGIIDHDRDPADDGGDPADGGVGDEGGGEEGGRKGMSPEVRADRVAGLLRLRNAFAQVSDDRAVVAEAGDDDEGGVDNEGGVDVGVGADDDAVLGRRVGKVEAIQAAAMHDIWHVVLMDDSKKVTEGDGSDDDDDGVVVVGSMDEAARALLDIVMHDPDSTCQQKIVECSAQASAFLASPAVSHLASQLGQEDRAAIHGALFSALTRARHTHSCSACPPSSSTPPPVQSADHQAVGVGEPLVLARVGSEFNRRAITSLVLPVVAQLRNVGPDQVPDAEAIKVYQWVRSGLEDALLLCSEELNPQASPACPGGEWELALTRPVRRAFGPLIASAIFATASNTAALPSVLATKLLTCVGSMGSAGSAGSVGGSTYLLLFGSFDPAHALAPALAPMLAPALASAVASTGLAASDGGPSGDGGPGGGGGPGGMGGALEPLRQLLLSCRLSQEDCGDWVW